MSYTTGKKKRLFLRWSLMAVVMGVASIICGYIGYFDNLYVMDASRISFIILIIFLLFTLYSGKLAWQAGDALDTLRDDIGARAVLRRVKRRAEHVWFGIALCEKLGLLGTLWGFLLVMITGFQQMSSVDPQAVKELLGGISIGVSTALLTTLVGLVCGLLLSIQHHDLVTAIEEVE